MLIEFHSHDVILMKNFDDFHLFFFIISLFHSIITKCDGEWGICIWESESFANCWNENLPNKNSNTS